MFLIFIICVGLLGLSLFEFLEKTEWDELSDRCEGTYVKNKKYGYYKIRHSHYALTSLIAISALGLTFVSIGAKQGLFSFGSDDKVPIEQLSANEMDTTEFLLATNDGADLPPEYSTPGGNLGDNMPQAQKGANEVSDREEQTNNDNSPSKPDKTKNMTDAEYQRYLEQSYFDETGGAAKRNQIKEQAEKEKKEREARNKAKQKEIQGGNGGTSGVQAKSKGNVAVTWKFDDGRDALNGNDGNVPPPAYTCGNDVDATVKVKVKVDAAGKVLEATVISASIPNSCIKENAKRYALKSRFEASSKPIQEGTITYRYEAR